MNLSVATRLIMLPRNPTLPVPCLDLDAQGHILARPFLDPAQAPAASPGVRHVVVVPGEAVRALWLDLPAHNPVQALAAARILLQDRIAADGDELHIAIGPATEAAPVLVAVTDEARMREWLSRCQALGIAADTLVPDHLLLATPLESGLQVMLRDHHWQVRGPQLAFTAEPALARHIVGEQAYDLVDDPAAVEALTVAAIMDPPREQLDLLQYAYARRRDGTPPRRWRRIALLAALCLLSPLLLLGTQTLRHALGARWLEHRADALAAAQWPQAADADPSAELHALHQRRAAPARLAVQATALFQAMDRLPGTRLDSLEYDPAGGLRAGLLHADEAALDALFQQLAAAGMNLQPLDSQAVEGGLRTQVVLEQAR